MATRLKKYAVVGFMSDQEARSALKAALERFKKDIPVSGNLSRCDGNIVYLHAENPKEKARMLEFLLAQAGAQPRGCRIKV